MKKCDHEDYSISEFDPCTDFEEFLSEARKNVTSEGILGVTITPPHLEVSNKKKTRNTSWKRTLFSWLKREKKNSDKGSPKMNMSKQSSGCVSGPVHCHRSATSTPRPRKTQSGPIMSLFFNDGGEEDGRVPYMSLEKMKTPKVVQSYGPVYLVT
ncbi:unnamed protein product [Cuscuta epithymum]|nr:unnamed protein product [Cuscuta epithymum]